MNVSSSEAVQPPYAATTTTIHKFHGFEDLVFVIVFSSMVLLLLGLTFACYIFKRYRPSPPQPTLSFGTAIYLGATIPNEADDHRLITVFSPGPLGLDEDVLLTFPTFLYSQAMLIHKGDNNDANASGDCSICLVDYKVGDVVRLLPECGHFFHVKCIDTWLKANPTCPMCGNSPIPEKENMHQVNMLFGILKLQGEKEAMGLMRRIPPKHTETALSALISLMPTYSSDLLSQVDQPLQVLCDVDNGREFLLCDYNRDADSYRSPWSNKYHPPLEGGQYPSLELRTLEIEANDVFTVYRDQYYEGGASSVYLWEDDDSEGFVACFLIKKDGSKYAHGRRGYLNEGAWDAIHVIQVGPDVEGMADYCLTSTVMLSMTTDHETSGTFSLSGSIRRQMKAELSVADGHLCNMGKMIEELEGKLRYSLDQVYFGKTKEMVWTLRPPTDLPSRRLP
ncbi:hypothetical protein OSB04_005622 [Centaurea solstitialis]|uniref:F-actin-capping protein subunit beta n=1 Tax=Centaurea solstitialis TaxID=347529 RepID=A0AA38WGZ3_9ASTR|nr:hypothetical protein OSB04_005622 [Centaurea solstitialis]